MTSHALNSKSNSTFAKKRDVSVNALPRVSGVMSMSIDEDHMDADVEKDQDKPEDKRCEITLLSTEEGDFYEKLDALTAWESVDDGNLEKSVKAIIENVKKNGDKALIEYNKLFDNYDVKDIKTMSYDKKTMAIALSAIDPEISHALE